MGFRAVFLRFVQNLGNERVTQIADKERCIKEPTFFELPYVSCIYLTSLVLQNCFCGVKFRAKFEVLLSTKTISVL